MGRLRGIQKLKKKRRNFQQTNLSVDEVVKSVANVPNSPDKSAVPFCESYHDISHNAPLCETPTVGSRPAGLQEAVDDCTSPTVGL